ncbi:ribonuclease HII [Kovacikia minuta CCNUW1]|uniref:ribonuclease HII n=1 Tax=Kovacikia minuta TaxID=2931930 RepID=UPI001CCBAD15|nr:ribonuclease HII [Kovacikia minuta]UBF26292.1 ribonuclease HII [Kovacikia minuta CCNUW1]
MVGDQLALPGLTDCCAFEGAIAGIDEVGRGALFGPVVAAAVILPAVAVPILTTAGVTDSKLLSPEQRQSLAVQIRTVAVDCQIGYATVYEIDRLNILQASLLAMKRAVLKLKVQPELCLVDGNQRIPGLPFPQQTLIKGDQKSLAIAAASIIAKVWRDELITRLSMRYPQFNLASNKGYGTPSHRKAIQQFGPSRLHRRSFSPCRIQEQRI